MKLEQVGYTDPMHYVASRPLSLLESTIAVYRNPFSMFPKEAYEQPVYETKLLGGETIVVSDPDIIEHVLIKNAANYPHSKFRQTIMAQILGKDGIVVSEGEQWARYRKLFAPAFTPKAVARYAGSMRDISLEFCSRIRDASLRSEDGTIDLARLIDFLTFKVMSSILFSDDLDSTMPVILKHGRSAFDTIAKVDPFDLLALPNWIPRLTKLPGLRSTIFFENLIHRTITRRKKRLKKRAETAPQDLLTLMLQADGMTHKEVRDNVMSFIAAGFETTSSALLWAILLLARSPHAQERIQEEVDRVLDVNTDPVTWLASLPYTKAVFEESMRMFPPVATLQREAIVEETVKGVTLRPGVAIRMSPFIVHRNATNFENPSTFIPERFLPENRGSIKRCQFMPFGAGARSCLGGHFAMMEGVIALAILTKTFAFDPTDDSEPVPIQRFSARPIDGVPIRATPRSRQ